MSSDDANNPSLTRRGMLTMTAATSLSSILPAQVQARSGNVTLLGGFEDDRDGWKTNGGNALTRVTSDEYAAGVTQGTRALKTEVRGDPHPAIENKSRVKRANFAERPYLVADVLAGQVSDTDSDLTFKFRYHHRGTPANGGTGNGGKDNRQQKSVLVEESAEMTVSPLLPTQLYWDMSHLADEALANPKRLEIAWYPTDHPPEGGSRGRGGGFDYRGHVVFDNVRLTDSGDEVSVAAIRSKVQSAKLDHGPLTETRVESRSDSLEVGRFVFADGATIPYEFEEVGEDEYLYTIDGETFEIGGGR